MKLRLRSSAKNSRIWASSSFCAIASPNRFLLARYLPSVFLSLSAAAAGDLGAAAGTRSAAARYGRLAWRGILATGHEEEDARDEAACRSGTTAETPWPVSGKSTLASGSGEEQCHRAVCLFAKQGSISVGVAPSAVRMAAWGVASGKTQSADFLTEPSVCTW